MSLVLPFVAVAGPEDHTPGAVYATKSPVSYYLMSFVFDDAKVSNDGVNLVIEARYGNLRGEFKITSTSRHNEDRVSFTAQKTIINKWESGCGAGEVAVITIKGEDNAALGVYVQGLDISVEYTTTTDTCHVAAVTKTINYKLAQ